MSGGTEVTPTSIEEFLRTQPRSARWRQWLKGRRYRITRFTDRKTPLIIIAHSFRDAAMARLFALIIERDWASVPAACRDAYDEILLNAPELIVVQLRRKNLCRCLGHRHPVIREEPFAEHHEAFGGARVGEMDIAWQTVRNWQGLPISDTALDVKFLEGPRLEEFHSAQFRLRMLSVFLHETNHLAASHESESAVLTRSLGFYRDSLAAYVEEMLSTLSLTIDRSFRAWEKIDLARGAGRYPCHPSGASQSRADLPNALNKHHLTALLSFSTPSDSKPLNGFVLLWKTVIC